MATNKEMGMRIKQFRKSLKLTLKQLEKDTCLSNSNISRIERGEIAPNFEFLADLQKKYGLNLNWVSSGTGKMFQDSIDIRKLYPDIPDDELTNDLLKCLQVPVIFHYVIATFIPLKRQHQDIIDEYFEIKEDKKNVG